MFYQINLVIKYLLPDQVRPNNEHISAFFCLSVLKNSACLVLSNLQLIIFILRYSHQKWNIMFWSEFDFLGWEMPYKISLTLLLPAAVVAVILVVLLSARQAVQYNLTLIIQFLNSLIFLALQLGLISRDPPFKEWYVRFTPLLMKALCKQESICCLSLRKLIILNCGFSFKDFCEYIL